MYQKLDDFEPERCEITVPAQNFPSEQGPNWTGCSTNPIKLIQFEISGLYSIIFGGVDSFSAATVSGGFTDAFSQGFLPPLPMTVAEKTRICCEITHFWVRSFAALEWYSDEDTTLVNVLEIKFIVSYYEFRWTVLPENFWGRWENLEDKKKALILFWAKGLREISD